MKLSQQAQHPEAQHDACKPHARSLATARDVTADNEGNDAARAGLARLRGLMAELPPGPIDDDQLLQTQIESSLAACWDKIAGSDAHGMSPEKLARMNELVWEPPQLCFRIERHGAFVLGSTRAELQHWQVDVENATARAYVGGYRQLGISAPHVNVKMIADEIAELILEGARDKRLQWGPEDAWVRVLISEIDELGAEAKQTREGRRKRFHRELEQRLIAKGWTRVPGRIKGMWAPPASSR